MLPENVQAGPIEGAVAAASWRPEGKADHRGYWESFYASRTSGQVPSAPSPFARWVAERESTNTSLVDVGSGTGRDTLWFSREGYRCVGLDYAGSAVNSALKAAEDAGLPARFLQANLYDRLGMLERAVAIRQDYTPEVLYGRFLLHAIEDDARQNLWEFAKAVLPTGGRVYIEFRIRPTHHEFGEHYRHFVDPAIVVTEVRALGWRVLDHLEGRGLAVYKGEDPLVCRLVFGL